MGISTIVALMRQGIFQVLTLAGGPLVCALVVGLIVAVFMAVTSIQEQTLTFLPKLVVILVVVALLAGWMFARMRGYTITLFGMIPSLANS